MPVETENYITILDSTLDFRVFCITFWIAVYITINRIVQTFIDHRLVAKVESDSPEYIWSEIPFSRCQLLSLRSKGLFKRSWNLLARLFSVSLLTKIPLSNSTISNSLNRLHDDCVHNKLRIPTYVRTNQHPNLDFRSNGNNQKEKTSFKRWKLLLSILPSDSFSTLNLPTKGIIPINSAIVPAISFVL